MEERQAERESIHQAVLDGDWETFSTLTADHDGPGLHMAITEETFPQLTAIALKMVEVKTMREELAAKLGVELPEKGPRQRAFARGARGGFHAGRNFGMGA
jgi:hypothetical protein